MTDILVWGGPVYCTTLDKVEWRRPTKVICKTAHGSTANAALYTGLRPLVEHVEDVGRIGLAGFSAFHGFARAMLADPAARESVDYVHLADACFMNAGATAPFAPFSWFARRAVAGEVRLVATTNGPMGKDISYSAAGKSYHLTSGARCIQLVWDEVVGGTGDGAPATPSGAPEPTEAHQAGEFYWFHYETAHGRTDAHGWHANVLAAPYVQAYGAPWLGRGGAENGSGGGRSSGLAMLALGGLSAAALVGAHLLLRRT